MILRRSVSPMSGKSFPSSSTSFSRLKTADFTRGGRDDPPFSSGQIRRQHGDGVRGGAVRVADGPISQNSTAPAVPQKALRIMTANHFKAAKLAPTPAAPQTEILTTFRATAHRIF